MGGLIDAQTDASGQQYKRNRYYDPVTGRFTQEDPIGLAGGVNAYGFADGDPINYSDPFGLCPIDKPLCSWIEATSTFLGSLAGFTLGGGGGILVTVGTGGVGVPAVPAGAYAGAATGATTGFALGKALTKVMFREGSGSGSSGGADRPQIQRGETANVNHAIRRLGLDRNEASDILHQISEQLAFGAAIMFGSTRPVAPCGARELVKLSATHRRFLT